MTRDYRNNQREELEDNEIYNRNMDILLERMNVEKGSGRWDNTTKGGKYPEYIESCTA